MKKYDIHSRIGQDNIGFHENRKHFEELFKSLCEPLTRFACRFVRDREIAENIIQDVFLRLWLNQNRLDPDIKIKSYLYTAVRNQSLQHLRNSGIREKYLTRIKLDINPAVTPEQELLTKEIAKSIQTAVNNLPERCRQIFSMNRYDNLTYREIAGILGLSEKTIETQMGRALKFLRKHLVHFMSSLPK